jgi:hypothetical protein
MPVLSNAKHELFCQHLALGKTASDAYEMAGYKPSRSNASVLRAKQSVSDRLSEILQQSEEKVVGQIEYTRDALLSELEEERQLALKRGQASAAVAATMGKAKILGLIIDRREAGEVGAFDHLTDEELVAEATRRARELGLSVRDWSRMTTKSRFSRGRRNLQRPTIGWLSVLGVVFRTSSVVTKPVWRGTPPHALASIKPPTDVRFCGRYWV